MWQQWNMSAEGSCIVVYTAKLLNICLAQWNGWTFCQCRRWVDLVACTALCIPQALWQISTLEHAELDSQCEGPLWSSSAEIEIEHSSWQSPVCSNQTHNNSTVTWSGMVITAFVARWPRTVWTVDTGKFYARSSRTGNKTVSKANKRRQLQVENSYITTKTLVPYFDTSIFIRRSWHSVLPNLDATISCRIKKAVVGVTELITALVSILQLLLMKISWWDRNVKIRYKF